MTQPTPGFGSYIVTEAVANALPVGRNSPQKAPFGLFAELLSGAAFTAPRSENRRTWVYRMRPTAAHAPFMPYSGAVHLRSGPFNEVPPSPNRLRWNPLPIPAMPTDFVDGLITYGGTGCPATQSGVGIHAYVANKSMQDRYFFNADGELLLVPQQGAIQIATELGILNASPGQIVIVPRGVRFRVELPDGQARGYVCENYGEPLRLPELGPIG